MPPIDSDNLSDSNDRPLLERDIQAFLEENLNLLGEELILVRKEYPVPFGRIDLLAKDRRDCLVAIELKLGSAGRDAIGQLQSYMGALQAADPKLFVRGILIAAKLDLGAEAALRMARDIKFFAYSVQYTFREAGKEESTYADWLKRKTPSQQQITQEPSKLWIPPSYRR